MAGNLDAILGLASGAGGLLLVQFGSLMPSKREFLNDVALKLETHIERVAAHHCTLIRECIVCDKSGALDGFDIAMRGDGKSARDFFAEYTQVSVNGALIHHKLLGYKRLFLVAHAVLFFTLILLVVLGVSAFLFPLSGGWFAWLIGVLIAVELVMIGVIYVVNSGVESL